MEPQQGAPPSIHRFTGVIWVKHDTDQSLVPR